MSNINTSYTPLTLDTIKGAKRAATPPSSYIKKIEVGVHQYRILPAVGGDPGFFTEVWQHWVDVQATGKRAPFNCPQRMQNSPCPGCQQVAQWQQSGDPTLLEAADKLEAQGLILVNVIDRSAPEDGIKVWQMKPGILRDVLAQYEMMGKQDFTNPITGRDVIVQRTGTGKTDTRYMVRFSDSCRLAETDEQVDQWLSTTKPLAPRATVLTLPEIADLIQNGPKRRTNVPTMSITPQVGAQVGQALSAPVVDASSFTSGGEENI